MICFCCISCDYFLSVSSGVENISNLRVRNISGFNINVKAYNNGIIYDDMVIPNNSKIEKSIVNGQYQGEVNKNTYRVF